MKKILFLFISACFFTTTVFSKEQYLSCIDKEYPDSDLSETIIILDLENYTLWFNEKMFQFMIYEQTEGHILAQEANTGSARIKINRLTGVLKFYSEDEELISTFDCEAMQKKF